MLYLVTGFRKFHAHRIEAEVRMHTVPLWTELRDACVLGHLRELAEEAEMDQSPTG